ncbi:MAG: glutathione S-transferase family protein [Synechococcus sp.]
MLRLHGHELSGNSYKVRLLLDLLGLPYEWVRVDLLQGEHKGPAFLALNPFGQVPVLEEVGTTPEERGTVLADAQAILFYLAASQGDGLWLPTDPLEQARVVRWLSTAAGEVRQGPESARLHHLFGVKAIPIGRAQEKAAFLLEQLERHLGQRLWLELDRPTIADLAVFPYVALAGDGGIDLAPYPQVRAWIRRIQALPGYRPMAGLDAAAAPQP